MKQQEAPPSLPFLNWPPGLLVLTEVRDGLDPNANTPRFWFELKVPVSGTTRHDYHNSHPNHFEIEEFERKDHNLTHESMCYKVTRNFKAPNLNYLVELTACM